MSDHIYIDGKRYFHYLNNPEKKNLMSSTNKGNFYVSRDKVLKDGTISKVYTTFKDFFEFRKVLENTPEELRNFYELVREKTPRKAYFDIDISRAAGNFSNVEKFIKFSLNVVDSLIKQILIKHNFIEKKNIIILANYDYTTKASFHVIINGFYFDDHLQCRLFCNEIIDEVYRLNPSFNLYGEVIDRKVYSKNQNFRMYLNRKINKSPLFLWEDYPYGDDEYIDTSFFNRDSEYTKFYDTLLTYVHGCKKYELEFEIKRKAYNSSISYTDGAPEKILHVVTERYGQCYTIRNIEGGLISLNRIPGKRHKCDACGVTHQNENPFIICYGGKVWFDCNRRTDKKRIELCTNNFTEGEILEKDVINPPKNIKVTASSGVFNFIPPGFCLKI